MGHRPREAEAGRLLVVTADHDASVTLCFDHLPKPWRERTEVVCPGQQSPEQMNGASAVVFVRYLFDCLDFDGRPVPVTRWIDAARRLGVPCYYFLDDNLMELGRHPEYREAWGAFSDERLRAILASFEGVLLSSHPLIDYFRQRRIHPRPLYYPPIAATARPFDPRRVRGDGGVFRVGYFGGGHRIAALLGTVLPAVGQLSLGGPVEMVAVAQGGEIDRLRGAAAPWTSLRVTGLPYDLSYDHALGRLAAQGIDALAHPNSSNPNNRYKTWNVLINAIALDAVLVTSDAPPYDGLRGRGVAHLCRDEAAHWAERLEGVRANPAAAAEMRTRAAALCRERFDGRVNVALLREMLAKPAPAPSSAPMDVPAGRLRIKCWSSFPVVPDQDGWSGLDLYAEPEPGCGDLVVSVLTAAGKRLREQSLRLETSGGHLLQVRFPSIVNAGGRRFDLELASGGALAVAAEGESIWRRLWFS